MNREIKRQEARASTLSLSLSPQGSAREEKNEGMIGREGCGWGMFVFRRYRVQD